LVPIVCGVHHTRRTRRLSVITVEQSFLGIVMRTQLILLASVAALVAACSEPQPPTSPAAEPNLGTRPAFSSAAPQVAAAGKPADQVGFTKVVRVESPIAAITANGDGSAVAYCPAGTTAVGGGHYLTGAALVFSPPFVAVSQPIPGVNPGYGVTVLNHAAGNGPVNLKAIALCAS
jgi:hypothetical protein